MLFKWTKFCPEFCNFEKPCEDLVEDFGEDESLEYGFLIKAGGVYYFSKEFEVNENERVLVFHPSVKLGEDRFAYKVEKELTSSVSLKLKAQSHLTRFCGKVSLLNSANP